MKALEILKKERLLITHIDNVSIDEAIAELEALEAKYKQVLEDYFTLSSEALQDPKTCDNCEYYKHSEQYCTNADADIPEKYFEKCSDDCYCDEHLLING